ncbi:MAG: hypothetical protein DMF92_14140 [Acidobacteria bacterium]|nr:MAG: hypothetical protein DMF92_14140 [Acidobacteriota bacterium]
MSNENRDGESPKAWADAAVVPPRRHQLRVDLSERNAAVLRLARECEDFDVQMVHLPIGDYFIDSGVVVERKTYADFATSLAHALKGAIVSLAVMWRLPVLHARDPEDALRILRFLAQQVRDSEQRILRRYDGKPKRLASRRLYMLQGLSGVGPALAQRLLIKFGSVEHVVTADEESMTQVRGIGLRKAARIRELVGG